jgi:hypothetical protein
MKITIESVIVMQVTLALKLNIWWGAPYQSTLDSGYSVPIRSTRRMLLPHRLTGVVWKVLGYYDVAT